MRAKKVSWTQEEYAKLPAAVAQFKAKTITSEQLSEMFQGRSWKAILSRHELGNTKTPTKRPSTVAVYQAKELRLIDGNRIVTFREVVA